MSDLMIKEFKEYDVYDANCPLILQPNTIKQHLNSKLSLRLITINTYTARPVCWREWISWQLL